MTDDNFLPPGEVPNDPPNGLPYMAEPRSQPVGEGSMHPLYGVLAEKAKEHAASLGFSEKYAYGFLNAMWYAIDAVLRADEPLWCSDCNGWTTHTFEGHLAWAEEWKDAIEAPHPNAGKVLTSKGWREPATYVPDSDA